MADQQQYSNNTNDLFAEISVKLRDIEEKQNLIKDRVLLIGDNLVAEKEDSDKSILELKSEMSALNEEIKRVKLVIERIIEETSSFARKNELEILQRQFEMFKPLELARMSDVEAMINRALKDKSK